MKEQKVKFQGWKDNIFMLNAACDSLNTALGVIIKLQVSISPTLVIVQGVLHLHQHQTCMEVADPAPMKRQLITSISTAKWVPQLENHETKTVKIIGVDDS